MLGLIFYYIGLLSVAIYLLKIIVDLYQVFSSKEKLNNHPKGLLIVAIIEMIAVTYYIYFNFIN